MRLTTGRLILSGQNPQDESDHLSPDEMKRWLELETADVKRAADLRLKEAGAFVTAYSNGEISAKEAMYRQYEYQNRWGEALPGVWRSEGVPDEVILRKIDETRVARGLLDKHVLSRRKAGNSDLAK
jgi:hypothetical protein